MFPLTAGESETLNNLKSQTVISSQHGGRRRSEPNAFTQEGIAMLSSVLRSPRAIEMNIMIMRAFVRMRELIAANKDLAERVEKLERGQKQTVNIIEVLVEDIDRLGVEVTQMKAPRVSKKNPIGFPVARAATP